MVSHFPATCHTILWYCICSASANDYFGRSTSKWSSVPFLSFLNSILLPSPLLQNPYPHHETDSFSVSSTLSMNIKNVHSPEQSSRVRPVGHLLVLPEYPMPYTHGHPHPHTRFFASTLSLHIRCTSRNVSMPSQFNFNCERLALLPCALSSYPVFKITQPNLRTR